MSLDRRPLLAADGQEIKEGLGGEGSCLTRRKLHNSGRFIQEVQPSTPIVQFTRNIFDIPFHPLLSCLVCPCL
ncbi:hypothetical protein TNCV_89981 [Trichonephila clavipes]|nr:hypothetical protein TNCV_89981 [Trichonephila clavipes]